MSATLALPLVIPWVGAAAIALFDGRRRPVAAVALGMLGAALVATAVLLAETIADGPRTTVAGGWPEGVGIALRADALGSVFALLSLAVLFSALAHELAAGVRTRHFPALVLFLAAGLTGLFLTRDVFNFYVFFELSMIAAYVLTAYAAAERESAASLIFAVVNLVGSFVFLLGVAALYHVSGTLDMEIAAERMRGAEPATLVMIAVTMFVAFGVKLGLFPFHFWLPAVYTGASPVVVAILSGAVANIGAYGLLRLGGDLLESQLRLASTALIAIGVASALYGALQAISCRDTAEVLAYSAVGQAGYILIALGVGGPVGYAAAVLYAIVNSLNKALLFLAAGMRGWLVGAAFAIGALSVAGVPPSAGFLAKAAVFRSGIEAESPLLVALLFVAGALSFVYMFQAYQRRHWAREEDDGSASALPLRALALALAAIVVALGAWPEPLLAVAREAAGALPGGRS